MGAWLNSLHVGTSDLDAVRAGVEEATRAQPFVADVVASESDGWVSVYADPMMPLAACAEAVSRALPDAVVLQVAVYDSDAAQLSLCTGGRSVARLQSPPEAFDGESFGDAGEWAPFLLEPTQADELSGIWKDDPLYAEDYVARTAPLLGLSAERLTAAVVDFEPDAPGVVRLRVGTPDAAPEPTGPTRLVSGGGPLDRNEGIGGEPFRFMYSPRNRGAPARGLRVVVSGTAVERGHVELSSICVRRGAAGDAPVPLEATKRQITATLPDQVIASPLVFVEGTYTSPGRGTLSVRLEPMNEPASGAFATSQTVVVLPPGRRPLRSVGDHHALRQMWSEPTHVSACVVLRPSAESREQAVSLALELLRMLSLPKGTELRRIAFVPMKRPRDGRVKSDKLTRAYLTKRLEGASSLLLSRERADYRVTDAVAIDLLPIAAERAPEDAAPHVAFSAAADSPSEVARVVAALEAVIDAFAREAPIHQAFIDRTAGALMNLDSMSYEAACGVTGQCTQLDWWVERWLRNVTPTLWIGGPLLARVDRAAVSAHASIAELSPDAIRVRTADEDLDALERALADILPGPTDWKAGANRLYDWE